MHKDYVTAKAKGDAISYIILFAVAGALMSLTSGCGNYRVRAELSGEEIDTHEESVTIRKSSPFVCRFYKFEGCPAEQAPK